MAHEGMDAPLSQAASSRDSVLAGVFMTEDETNLAEKLRANIEFTHNIASTWHDGEEGPKYV